MVKRTTKLETNVQQVQPVEVKAQPAEPKVELKVKAKRAETPWIKHCRQEWASWGKGNMAYKDFLKSDKLRQGYKK
jgi:hypothetical protein